LSLSTSTNFPLPSPTIFTQSAPDIHPAFVAFKADLLSAKPTILNEFFLEAQAFFQTTRFSRTRSTATCVAVSRSELTW